MESEQDFNQHDEEIKQNFQEAEDCEAEANYYAFFGEGSEEEQLRIREIASKLNIRSNDAIWIIVFIFNYFGRFYQHLPQKIKSVVNDALNDCVDTLKRSAEIISQNEAQKSQDIFSDTLTRISQEILNQHKKKMRLYDFFLPLAWSCLGIFVLCLISFVGGAAVAGRGWGHSPFEAMLNAPAGWIIPLALIPVGGVALYQGLTEQGKAKYLSLTAAFLIAALVSCVLSHIL
mgnify:FL=1